MTEEMLLSRPFSIQDHKQYGRCLDLELLISPAGEVEYALPSHQEGLIKKAMEKNGWTRQEMMDACPPEYYFDFMEWLIMASGGYIPVWPRAVLAASITKEQRSALRQLKMAGLYKGKVPAATKQ